MTQGHTGKMSKAGLTYSPHPPSGVWSVGAQHWYYFNTYHRNERPKEAFWKDLKKFLRHWKTEGEYIILMIDVNDDVRSQEMISF
jgi:hypothetical protein